MKRVLRFIWIFGAGIYLLPVDAVADPVGTAFTYQGQLKQSGVPLNGTADFRFTLWDAETDGAQIGSSVAVDNVDVVNGLFTVQLDFGAGAVAGEARWLAVAARSPHDPSDTNPFTPLDPRQPLTAAPVAAYALDGPGSSGYWMESGTAIYNTNTGTVGVGLTAPLFNLHVFDRVPSGSFQPPTTFGVQWQQAVLPTPPNEWFYFAVGGSGPVGVSGTRLIRESGTELHFQTQDGIYSGEPSTQMVLDADGKLGIGTTTPISLLEVVSGTGVHGIRSTTSAIPVAAYRTSTSGTWPAIHGECNSEVANGSAVRGIMTSTSPGSSSAALRGINNGTGGAGIGVHGSQDGSGYGVYGYTPDGRGVYGRSASGVGVYGRSETGVGVKGISYSADGYAGVFGDMSTPGKGLLVATESHLVGRVAIGAISVPSGVMLYVNGKASIDVLEITGADVAEKFPVSEAADAIAPGMVMEIDPENPGKLRIARGAYNRRVAGVVSGAGDVPTGTIMGNLPGYEDAPAIALNGRVWVFCDATDHAIEPGDLLTTSDTPGHAMAVTEHTRAIGAILGKAMTALDKGEIGMVLVLVNLQ